MVLQIKVCPHVGLLLPASWDLVYSSIWSLGVFLSGLGVLLSFVTSPVFSLLNEGSLSICLLPLKHFPLCCMFYLTPSSFNFISPILFFSLLCCEFLLDLLSFFFFPWYIGITLKFLSVLFFLFILWRWNSPLCREAGVALEIFSWGWTNSCFGLYTFSLSGSYERLVQSMETSLWVSFTCALSCLPAIYMEPSSSFLPPTPRARSLSFQHLAIENPALKSHIQFCTSVGFSLYDFCNGFWHLEISPILAFKFGWFFFFF